MIELKRSLLFCLCVVVLSSCVSKKVYNDMVASRNTAQKQLETLKKQNQNMKSDFETMKADLLASNAQKDTDIAQALAEVKKQQLKTDDLNKELKNVSQLYSSQKSYGSNKTKEMDQLKATLDDLRAKNSGVEYSLKMAQDRADQSNKALLDLRKSMTDQSGSSHQLEVDNAAAKKQIELLNSQIIQNKQVLDAAGVQFVALRKDLLRAKSSGAPLDPNSNENVTKLAKTLGQE